jgi:hypothetical protein
VIKQIYIDMDDVLNTASPALLRWLGASLYADDYEDYARQAGESARQYDILAHWNAMMPHCRIETYREFWPRFTVQAWAELPMSEDCDWLVQVCGSLVGQENVRVMTAPVVGPGEEQNIVGKLRWAYDCLPKWLRLGIEPEKGLLGAPGRLLIDDTEKNTKLWSARGGSSLLWARPWNTAQPMDRNQLATFLTDWVHDANAISA